MTDHFVANPFDGPVVENAAGGRTEGSVTDQTMPSGGTGKPANAVLFDEFRSVLIRQTSKGARKYGQPVRAWNGRDSGRDAIEEWVDLGVYLTQLRLEHDDLIAENARLRSENAALKGETP